MINVQHTEQKLRKYFREKKKRLPDKFPCPQPQRVEVRQALNQYIDHTLLKQTAVSEDYVTLFRQAGKWKPFSVCVPPVRVPDALEALEGSEVKVCTVVGFPWGYDSSQAKVVDATWALSKGCDEIDMVASIAFLKEGNYLAAFDDIQAVVDATNGHVLKVILETAELSNEDVVAAALIAGWAGAWFIKTSTGFASGGASLESVRLMRQVAANHLGVKASGGIRDRAFTEALIDAGADRIGTSATGTILGYNMDGSSGY